MNVLNVFSVAINMFQLCVLGVYLKGMAVNH